MRIARTIAQLRTHRAGLGAGVALVPTMGALHDGHMALVAAARAAGGPVAASIFVNPLQFGPRENFAHYPRTEAADLEKLAAAGCDLVWLPDVATMYPADGATTITVAGPALRWEGERRPGHFDGVATVVAKLFGQIRPARAYFGEKDFQQIRVIAKMVGDLSLPVEVNAVPTVREADGLALSSRNRFLNAAEREQAPRLPRALTMAAARITAGAPVDAALQAGVASLRDAGMPPDYFALVDAETLAPLAVTGRPARLLAAAALGPIRLLDNIAV